MVEASPFICLVVPLDDCFERTETFLLPEALSGFVAVSVCVGVLIEQVRLFTFWATIVLPLARAAFRRAVCSYYMCANCLMKSCVMLPVRLMMLKVWRCWLMKTISTMTFFFCRK